MYYAEGKDTWVLFGWTIAQVFGKYSQGTIMLQYVKGFKDMFKFSIRLGTHTL